MRLKYSILTLILASAAAGTLNAKQRITEETWLTPGIAPNGHTGPVAPVSYRYKLPTNIGAGGNSYPLNGELIFGNDVIKAVVTIRAPQTTELLNPETLEITPNEAFLSRQIIAIELNEQPFYDTDIFLDVQLTLVANTANLTARSFHIRVPGTAGAAPKPGKSNTTSVLSKDKTRHIQLPIIESTYKAK